MLKAILVARAAKPKLLAEATALEDELGADGAVEVVRRRILEADRGARRRLYRLHDEIARRRQPGALSSVDASADVRLIR